MLSRIHIHALTVFPHPNGKPEKEHRTRFEEIRRVIAMEASFLSLKQVQTAADSYLGILQLN